LYLSGFILIFLCLFLCSAPDVAPLAPDVAPDKFTIRCKEKAYTVRGSYVLHPLHLIFTMILHMRVRAYMRMRMREKHVIIRCIRCRG